MFTSVLALEENTAGMWNGAYGVASAWQCGGRVCY